MKEETETRYYWEIDGVEHEGANCGKCGFKTQCEVFGSLVYPIFEAMRENVSSPEELPVKALECRNLEGNDMLEDYILGGVYSYVEATTSGDVSDEIVREKKLSEPLADLMMEFQLRMRGIK